jgi:hypothetical protein
MKKYQLSGLVTISIFTEVEANSLEEAIQIADNREIQAYRHGDKDQASEAWVSEEFDGTPVKIEET